MLLSASRKALRLTKTANLISEIGSGASRVVRGTEHLMEDARRAHLIEELPLPAAVQANWAARASKSHPSITNSIRRPAMNSAVRSAPVGPAMSEAEVLGNTAISRTAVRPVEQAAQSPITRMPQPQPEMPQPQKRSPWLLPGAMGAAGLTALALRPRHEDQPKIAFVGTVAGGIGRAAVKGTIGAGKMLYRVAKHPVGGPALGTAAVTGLLGGAGFVRGSKADLANGPEAESITRPSPPMGVER
jgi:hypothetical protein